MMPTALYLALFALLLVGVAFGAVLLNVPLLWVAILTVAATALALGLATRPRRRP
jgi:hypothetical protein